MTRDSYRRAVYARTENSEEDQNRSSQDQERAEDDDEEAQEDALIPAPRGERKGLAIAAGPFCLLEPDDVMRCPCCHGLVDTDVPMVDLNRNRVSYSDHTIGPLRPQIAEILHTLALAGPKATSYSELASALWGCHEPERCVETIRTLISQTRRAIEPIGLSIEYFYARGYIMSATDTATLHPVA